MVWTNSNRNAASSFQSQPQQHECGNTNFRTGNGETIDKFAQRILEAAATAHSGGEDHQPVEDDGSVSDVVTVDDNLGAYVVHSLQESLKSAAELSDSYDLLESLTELLQDQCRIQSPHTAQEVLQQIANEVFAPRQPTQTSTTPYSGLSAALLQSHRVPTHPIISSVAAQSLLPGALLEEEEEDDGNKPNADDETAFPPLGAATDGVCDSTIPAKHHHHHHHQNSRHRAHHSQQSSSNSDEASELAAALFRPTTRSRQSSMDETSSSYSDVRNGGSSLSPNLQPMSIPEQQPPSTAASVDLSSSLELDPMFVQYSAEWLLDLNAAAEQPLSPDAAYAVTVLSCGDVNVAQYILEQVLHKQLPVCRHLLQDGKCYRADCSFSHDDIETHTCLFWLKSRCTKANDCRFLHGFHNKWLDQVPAEVPQYYDYGAVTDQLMLEQELQEQQQLGTYNSGSDFSVDRGLTIDFDNNELHPHRQQETPSSFALMGSSYNPTTSSAWIPSPSTKGSGSGGISFANVASKGYSDRQSFAASSKTGSYDGKHKNNSNDASTVQKVKDLPTVLIPQDLWNPQENRDASAFCIADPLERYYTVTAAVPHRNDVIDLHFQSLKTFATVLDVILPEKLQNLQSVWIVTGTGHHVGSRTHQKGGGTLERAVLDYVVEYYGPPLYSVKRGRDRNGQGGAVLVEQKVRGSALG